MRMQPAEDATPTTPERRSFVQWLAARSRWEKGALMVSVTAAVGGGVLSLFTGDDPTTAAIQPGGGAGSALGAQLVADAPTGEAKTLESESGEPASRGVFRLGFSFLAGYCSGAFVRTAMRIVAVAVGFWLVMTFALSYAGLVVVDWDAMDALWQRFAANVESEWGSFQSFMLGSLPATGLAVTGFAVGFRRR